MAGARAQENRWQLLDHHEGQWRPLLEHVSLVAEADIDPEESQPVLGALGYVYEKYRRHPERDKLMAFRHWPSCVAVGMTGAAATGYEEGRYWPDLWRAASYRGSAQDQRIWGESFLGALTQLGLPVFSGNRQTYLGPILMHCGIPTYCLGDLLRVLVGRLRRDPAMDADSFMSWVGELPSRVSSLDKPVQNLLRDGREYAYDIIDRLIELIDRMHDHEPDLFGVGLPRRLTDEAQLLAGQGTITLPLALSPNSRRRTRGKPRLALDPFGAGPLVMLPVRDGVWRVTVDGTAHDIRASAGLNSEHAEIPFPLPRPPRHVQVSLVGDAESPVAFAVVKDEDPLVIFNEDGDFLAGSQPLPPDPVWVLYREDRELVKGGEAPVICTAHVPFGWDGWTLREIDLREVSELGLSPDRVREVRGSGHPTLLLSEPLPGVTDLHHRPVYGSPPRISLPTGEFQRTWWVEVHQESAGGAGSPVRMRVQTGDADPWSELEHPIVGTYEITIIGALGFRFYRRICLAEGLAVSYRPSVRLLIRNGLDRAEAQITGPGLHSPVRLVFGEDQQDATIMYGKERLLITPPHLSVLHDSGTNRARWSPKPLQLSTESFTVSSPGTLLVRGPSTLRIPPLRVISGDVIQDVYSSGADREGHARYQLVQIKDTVAHVGYAELDLCIGDRVVPLASVNPPVFAEGAELSGAQLRLTGYRETPGLHIGLYQVYAPWRGATVQPVSHGGMILLPLPLRQSGPIRVFPAVLDARSSWPQWPHAAESFLVPTPGAPSSDDHAELSLSAFLAGDGPCPPDVNLEWLWFVAALAERLPADGTREDLRAQCGMCLRADPTASLIALSRTSLEPREAIATLIGSGLTALQAATHVDPDQARYLWTRLPAAAALVCGAALSNPGQVSSLTEIVAAEHGQRVAAILYGDTDPLLWEWDRRELRSLAPEALIDPVRVIAELDRGDRNHFAVRAPQLVADATELLAKTPYNVLADRITVRPAGPAMLSAALALSARAAAGDAALRRGFQRKYQDFWREIGRTFPDLVALDIIAAQAAVSAVDRDRNLRVRSYPAAELREQSGSAAPPRTKLWNRLGCGTHEAVQQRHM